MNCFNEEMMQKFDFLGKQETFVHHGGMMGDHNKITFSSVLGFKMQFYMYTTFVQVDKDEKLKPFVGKCAFREIFTSNKWSFTENG